MNCLIRLSLVWLVGFIGLAGAADDSFIEETARKVRNEAELRRIIETPAPVGELYSTLYDYYDKREAAAKQLGLHDLVLKNAQEWYDAMPPGAMKFLPRWQLWSHHKAYGDRVLAMKYGEETTAAATSAIDRFLTRFQLARDYLDQYEIRRARSLTDEGETALKEALGRRRDMAGQFNTARGRSTLLTLRSALARFDGKFVEAEHFALASMEPAKDAIAHSKYLSTRRQQTAYGSYLGAVSAIRKSYVALGKIYEAEMLLRETIDYLRNEDRLAPYYGSLMRHAAQLRISQGRFEDAARLARAGLRGIEGSGGINAQVVWTRQALLSAMIGLERWGEARDVVMVLEAETAASPPLRKLIESQSRGVVRLMNGEIAEAIALLKRSNDFNVERYGEAHYFSSQARGLYAAALVRKARAEGSETAEESARLLLASAVRDMLEARGLQAGTGDAGLRKLYRRLVYEAYLDALFPAMLRGEAAAIAEGFRIADILRGSSVQQAVVDAAVRAMANVPGLGELIRQMQDGQREIASLYDYIAQQMGEASERRNPQVVAQMRSRLAAVEKQQENLLIRIRQQFPEFDELARPLVPDVAVVAKYLGSQEAMLSVLVAPARTYLWLVTDAGIRFASAAAGRVEVAARIARLRGTLDVAGEVFPPAVDAEAAHALYRILVEPLRAHAGGREQWTIAAGGVVDTLPFPALLTRPGKAVEPVVAPWLIRELALAATPSVAAWLALRRLPRGAGTRKVLVAFGDPDFGGGGRATVGGVRNLSVTRRETNLSTGIDEVDASLGASAVTYQSIPPLPETRDELLAIAAVLSADKERDLYFGSAASRTTVLRLNGSNELAQRQVVMFATHGLVPGDLPGLGQPALALAYAGRGMEGSLLTLEDVLGLKLDADWVVLSACNTAAADGRSGEAISGLGRGFFYAGARALLLTHWAVESQSAKALTTATFTRYAANAASSRAQVLRQAQLSLLADPATAHPTYWAAFTLIGDGAR